MLRPDVGAESPPHGAVILPVNDVRKTPTIEEARETLRVRFAHEDFQGPQREIEQHVLMGGSAFVLLPTGAGKSICYQLTALLFDGVTVVLSPLIALMQDQVDALRRKASRRRLSTPR